MKAAYTLLIAGLLQLAASQPILPGQGFLPKGNLLTVDNGGPYNFSRLATQANTVKAQVAAKGNYTDKDIVDFLVNVECLEGLFDTWGTFGRGFLGDLEMGGPTPLGARKANLSDEALPYAQEVALNEQGHALFTRLAGGMNPCPLIDFDNGFNQFMAAAYLLPPGVSVAEYFGAPFDPFKNDVNFFLSMLSLEELGATGNKGLVGLITNPVLSDGVAGLATSATGQATIQRVFLWQHRNDTVEPFNETVQQVFARVSALRDSADGPQFDDQGLVNTDPRFIAVPARFFNGVPTDITGLTFSRTPQQNINILTLGNPNGTGVFFPNGLLGAINKPTGYNVTAAANDPFPSTVLFATQELQSQFGEVPPPITAAGPASVPGEESLTQALGGILTNPLATTRGLVTIPPALTNTSLATPVPTQATTPNVTQAAAGRK